MICIEIMSMFLKSIFMFVVPNELLLDTENILPAAKRTLLCIFSQSFSDTTVCLGSCVKVFQTLRSKCPVRPRIYKSRG